MRLPFTLPILLWFLICGVCFAQVGNPTLDKIHQLMRTGEVEEAESKARTLLEESPADLEVRLLVAQILNFDGRPEDSIKVLQDGIEQASKDGQRHLSFYIGSVAMKTAEDGPFVTRKRGTVSYQPADDSVDKQAFVDRYVKTAETAFQRAVDLFDDDIKSLYGLAQAVSLSSTPKRAVPLWKKLLEQGQAANPEFELEYIKLLFKIDRNDEAVELANKRLEKRPNDLATMGMLVEHYKANNNTKALNSLTAKAQFFESIPPFLNLEFSQESKERLAKLEDGEEVEKLLSTKTEESTEMLVVYVWRHPHNELEDRAFVELGNRKAFDHLNKLFDNAQSTCTVRGAVNQLARSKPKGLYEKLVRLLPGDLRTFGMQMDIANALETLHDERAIKPLIETLAVKLESEPKGENRFLKDREFARWRAAMALGAFDADLTAPVLKAGLENKMIRIACLAGLYRQNSSEKWLNEIKTVAEDSEADRPTIRQTVVVLDRLKDKLPADKAVQEIFEAFEARLKKKEAESQHSSAHANKLMRTGKPMNETIADVWQQVQQARNAKVKNPNPLNPPANEQQLEKLSEALGYDIPKALRESLLVHNGLNKAGIHQGFKPLSVDGIIKHWQADRQRAKEAKAEGDPVVKKPEWIPVFVEYASGEEQIYFDTKDGTLLHYNHAAGSYDDLVKDFRYGDYLTFLKVVEHHIRKDLWFEWGQGLDAKKFVPPLSLNKAGIKQLESETKQNVKVKFADGKVLTVAADQGNKLVNSILDAMKPVKFVRTPVVQNPDYEVEFKIGKVDYKIGIKKGPKEMLSYSINTANTQHSGGDPEKLKKIITAIIGPI